MSAEEVPGVPGPANEAAAARVAALQAFAAAQTEAGEGAFLEDEGVTAAKTATKKKKKKPIVIMEEEEYEAAAAAAAAAAPPAAKSTTARVRKPKARVEEAQTPKERMENFYAKKAKAKPAARAHFFYTPEGDLRVEGDEKVADETIVLRPFSALRPEERQVLEDTRQAALEAKEVEYTLALAKLREVTQQFKEGGASARDVVTANEALRSINLQRLAIAYPERWDKSLENPDRRVILLDQPHEMRKMGHEVYLYKRSDLGRQDALGHYREGEQAAAAAGTMEGGGSGQPILIDNPESEESGMFHPYNVHDFVVNETNYALPIQAYEGEHFASLGDETMRSQLLKTRSGQTVRKLVASDARRPTNPVQLWITVLQAYAEQVPNVRQQLLDTGSRPCHVTDPNVPEPVAYAEALAKVRTALREQSTDASETSIHAKQSVITKEEQKAQKTGAIIAYRRKFH